MDKKEKLLKDLKNYANLEEKMFRVIVTPLVDIENFITIFVAHQRPKQTKTAVADWLRRKSRPTPPSKINSPFRKNSKSSETSMILNLR